MTDIFTLTHQGALLRYTLLREEAILETETLFYTLSQNITINTKSQQQGFPTREHEEVDNKDSHDTLYLLSISKTKIKGNLDEEIN